jgi:hypothetical protein
MFGEGEGGVGLDVEDAEGFEGIDREYGGV